MNGEEKVARAVERADQLLRHYLSTHLDTLGVSELEAHLLARLATKGPCAVADLQKAFGLRPSTLTNALDRLERRRLLRRRLNPSDRRTFLLELNAAGKRASEEVIGLVDAVEARVSSLVSSRQLEGFHAVIAALEESLR